MNRLIKELTANKKVLILSALGLAALTLIFGSTILLGKSMSSQTSKAAKETASVAPNPLATKDDSDGDGIPNSVDKFPNDHDNDGIPDANDPDNDNDGIVNSKDLMPYDHNNNGINDGADPDDDSDGIPDNQDPYPYDYNNNGIPDSQDPPPGGVGNNGPKVTVGGGGSDSGSPGNSGSPGDSGWGNQQKPRIIP